jgi:hypothetical protein
MWEHHGTAVAATLDGIKLLNFQHLNPQITMPYTACNQQHAARTSSCCSLLCTADGCSPQNIAWRQTASFSQGLPNLASRAGIDGAASAAIAAAPAKLLSLLLTTLYLPPLLAPIPTARAMHHQLLQEPWSRAKHC